MRIAAFVLCIFASYPLRGRTADVVVTAPKNIAWGSMGILSTELVDGANISVYAEATSGDGWGGSNSAYVELGSGNWFRVNACKINHQI